jgi:catechol 2,3-dioxygenase-like lactoylglutathione lyase family enzyme
MRTTIAALWLVSNLAAGTAMAQPFTPNEMGVTMGHWHLNSRDIEAQKKLFVGMGGIAGPPGDLQRVVFPGVVVNLNLRAPAGPPTGGTDGSVVNHVGFTVQNVQEQVAKWKAAGVPVLPGNQMPNQPLPTNRTDQAYVVTPDGLKIEILENKNQKFPIMHEHVHFYVEEAVIPQIRAWYGKTFGATLGMRSNAPIADLPGTQLRFAKSNTALPTTKGRVLDHIGFDVKDLKAFITKLEAAGIKLDRPYTSNAPGAALAFITDPWGTYIELNERPNPAYIN